MIDIQVSMHTDIGDRKQTNQDSIFAKRDIVENKAVGLYIVADGCGGLAYGEEISNLTVTGFSRMWKNELPKLLTDKKCKDKDIDELLERTIADINANAKNFGSQVESKVGSTLSLLLTIDNRYYIKNVGDSRIYLKRKKRLIQLTEDQSLVAEMVRSGELTKEEAKNFNKKNVLTMCIGVFDKIMTNSKNGKIKSGDVFLLCCDGLHNKVSEKDMCNVMEDKEIDFEDKCEAMRNKIESGEASDNVSSVLCSYKIKRNPALKIICACVILMALVIGFFVLRTYMIDFVKEKIGGCTWNLSLAEYF